MLLLHRALKPHGSAHLFSQKPPANTEHLFPQDDLMSKTEWEGHWHPTGRLSLVRSGFRALMGQGREWGAEVLGAAHPFS